MKKIIAILMVLITVQANAQTYPVTSINISLPANPDANMTNWGNGTNVFNITATSKAVNGRVDGRVQESKILVTIKKNNTKICGTYTSNTAPASNFNTLTKVWSGTNAVSLIGQGCTLPAGEYELSVQFFGYGPTGTMPYSEEKVKAFTIRGTEQQTFQSPQALRPAMGAAFKENDFAKPILFRWTPVIPRPQEPVTYKLRVWQLMQGQNGSQAMRVNPPLMTKDIENLTQTILSLADIGPCKLPYLCEFVWNVQALERDGKPIGGNNGTSELFSFKRETLVANALVKLVSPANGSTLALGEKPNFSWKINVYPVNEPPTYKIKIVEIIGDQSPDQALRANKPFFEKDSMINLHTNKPIFEKDSIHALKLKYPLSAPKFKAGSKYAWGVQELNREGKPIGGTNTTDVFQFTAASCDVNLSLKLLSIECLPDLGRNRRYKINFSSTYTSNTYTLSYTQNGSGLTAYHPSYSPIYPTTNISPILQSQNTGGSSTVNYSVEVSVVIGQNAIKLGLQGDDKDPGPITCKPGAELDIILPVCSTSSDCTCGKWGMMSVQTAAGTKRYESGAKLPWKCNLPFKFSSTYECKTGAVKCEAKTSWAIKKENVLIKSGIGTSIITDGFTPTANGVYTITLSAVCGDVKCEPCVYYLVVEGCKPDISCVTPPMGMVAWWTFDEKAGQPLVDLAGVNNAGTSMNNPLSVPAKVAGGLKFNGTNNYVDVPNHAELNFGTGDFSFDAWIQINIASDLQDLVDKRSQQGTPTGYLIYLMDGKLGIQLRNGAFTNYTSPLFVADGKWHHIAITVSRKDKKGIVFYLDGVPTQFGNPTLQPGNIDNTSILRIGKDLYSNSYNFKGILDEIELFKRVLSPSEVRALYAADSAGKCKPKTEVACTIIRNGGFLLANQPGVMPAGSVQYWANAYGNPTVNNDAAEGFIEQGYIKLSGNISNGKAIMQSLDPNNKIVQGKKYKVSVAVRFKATESSVDYVRLRAIAFNGSISSSTGVHPLPTADVAIIGRSNKIKDCNDWSVIEFPVWVANKDFLNIAFNAFTNDNTNATLWIDNITVCETPEDGCDEVQIAANGSPIMPAGYGNTSTTAVSCNSEAEDDEYFNGSLVDLYPGYNGTADFYAQLSNSCFNIGGTLPDEVNTYNCNDSLKLAGIDMTCEELNELFNTDFKPEKTDPTILPPISPLSDGKCDLPKPTNMANMPFGGRDIIYIHGLQMSHLIDRALGVNGAIGKWPANKNEYVNGYYKTEALHNMGPHIDHFLRSRGNTNRYLVVTYDCAESAEVAIHAILTQIRDAMENGTGVQSDRSDRRGKNCFGRDYVMISHSTGALIADVALSIANKTKTQGILQTKYGNLGLISDRCKGRLSIQGAYSGSNLAKLALVAQGVSAPLFNKVLVALVPGAANVQALVANNGIIANSILVDLVPEITRSRWASYLNDISVPVFTIAGGHPSAILYALKYSIHPGFDDGVLTMDSSNGNNNPLSWGPSSFSATGSKVFDMGIPLQRGISYYLDQRISQGVFASGSIVNLSPTGMVQPVQSVNINPQQHFNNHFSFIQSAKEHWIKATETMADNEPNNVPCDYAKTFPGGAVNNEEQLVVANASLFNPSLIDPSIINQMGETVKGRSISFPLIKIIFRHGIPRPSIYWKTFYIWKRTYHNLIDNCMYDVDYGYKYLFIQ
ncbi:LamG domain-containing protein [Pedobacter sp. Du54]|uniref:LamG domain-containing protein n=1 Tax=Pedobacter anseongensis TaxID=3133439 RepID=UPI0030A02B89